MWSRVGRWQRNFVEPVDRNLERTELKHEFARGRRTYAGTFESLMETNEIRPSACTGYDERQYGGAST